jgi:hypothetical protein
MAWSKPTIPCPLCGVRECVAQEVIDVSAIGNGNKCTAFINGKKAVHICRRVGKQEYTLGPAANSNAEGPCTNRPVKCEHCSLTPPSYSMEAHYRRSHGTVEMSTKLKREVALAVHELEDTLQLRAKQVKVKPQREQCQLPDCPCGGPSKRQSSSRAAGKRPMGMDGPQVMRTPRLELNERILCARYLCERVI